MDECGSFALSGETLFLGRAIERAEALRRMDLALFY
jgi:hypothetical protein